MLVLSAFGGFQIFVDFFFMISSQVIHLTLVISTRWN